MLGFYSKLVIYSQQGTSKRWFLSFFVDLKVSHSSTAEALPLNWQPGATRNRQVSTMLLSIGNTATEATLLFVVTMDIFTLRTRTCTFRFQLAFVIGKTFSFTDITIV